MNKVSWFTNLKIAWQLNKLFSRYELMQEALSKFPEKYTLESDATRLDLLWELVLLFQIYNSDLSSAEVLIACLDQSQQTEIGRFFFEQDFSELCKKYISGGRMDSN